jgi:hypothetical protein
MEQPAVTTVSRKRFYYMASICFDESRNLIGCCEAGFSRIAHGQYAIFIALRREPSFKRQKMSQRLSNYSKRRKINIK